MAALRSTLHELVEALQAPGRDPALAE